MILSVLQNPVIVMGMAQCGTSLLAEMVHRGGTQMFAGDADPSYDRGLKYERPACQRINRQILGVGVDGQNPHSTKPMWTWPLNPFPYHEIDALRAEVGTGAWGVKDPRTTLTYRVWLEAFPQGPRLYSYRGHTEYLRRSMRTHKRFSPGRARRYLRAWLAYNEAVLQNCAADKAAGRRWALIHYDELMENADVIRWAEVAVGVPLFDARCPELRRTLPLASPRSRQELTPRERILLSVAKIGQQARLRHVYEGLDALRLRSPGRCPKRVQFFTTPK